MEQLLIAREAIVKFFKRFEVFIFPVLKFFLGLFLFSQINGIGHIHGSMAPVADALSSTMITWLFALLFTVMPMNMSWMIIILSVTLQFSANLEVAIAVFLFLMFIFLFYARMAPRESILIIFTMIGFHFNIPYLVPIIAGLYFPVTAIIPITVGVFVNSQIPMLNGLTLQGSVAAGMTDMDFADILTELPDAFSDIFAALINSFTATQTWLFTAIIFAMVIILVHVVSRQSIDFAKEISIALGCIMNIFGFVLAILVTDEPVRIGMVILWTLVCGVLAVVIRFFDGVLDYQRAESVQFEDDNNFYHVRVVPKVIMTKSQRVVKRIRPQPAAENPEEKVEEES